MTPEALPERVFALLRRGSAGEEPYLLPAEAGARVSGWLEACAAPERTALLRELFRVAWLLDTKLRAPAAARTLVQLGLRHGGPEVFGERLPEGPVPEATWRRLLGAERVLPRTADGVRAGKRPWELIGGDDPED